MRSRVGGVGGGWSSVGFVGVLVVWDPAHAGRISGGKPLASESSSLPRSVIGPTVCRGVINEQVFTCAPDAPPPPPGHGVKADNLSRATCRQQGARGPGASVKLCEDSNTTSLAAGEAWKLQFYFEVPVRILTEKLNTLWLMSCVSIEGPHPLKDAIKPKWDGLVFLLHPRLDPPPLQLSRSNRATDENVLRFKFKKEFLWQFPRLLPLLKNGSQWILAYVRPGRI